ncbi:MAG: nitronate monooxygenase [Alphaproteobacteria bacterium]|nr:nitronate monooxygenase [Alphaproteobacteria bacterium]
MTQSLMDRLGFEAPIFAFSHCRDVVVEATRAGGFGVLGSSLYAPEELEQELTWIDNHVGDRAYGVDILMTSNYDETVGGLSGPLADSLPASQLGFVEAWLDREGVPPMPEGLERERRSAQAKRERYITREGVQALVEVVWRHPKVKLLVSALGVAPPDVIEKAHARGILVGGVCGAPEHARRQCAAGADVLVAQGSEAGGHTGTISTMVLVPQVVEAAAGRAAVLAAGGIGSGQQIAAGLALGAEGVWCGSIWLVTRESDLLPFQKDVLLRARSQDTVQSRCMTGKPVRMNRSRYTDAWGSPDAPPTLGPPMQKVLYEAARSRIDRASRDDLYSWPVGQVVGLMRDETSVREVMLRLQTEYLETIDRMARTLASAEQRLTARAT